MTKKNKKRIDTLFIVRIAMLSAVSVILMLLEFPLPFIAPPFYELDFSEVPVLIGTFALGPVAGVIIEFIKVMLNLIINGTDTFGVGEFANFVMGISFIIPAGIVYKRKRTKKHAVIGLLFGTVIMVVVSSVVNAFVMIPAFVHFVPTITTELIISMGNAIYKSIDSIWKLVLLCVVPFNLIKYLSVSIITLLIYKPMRRILKSN